MAHPIHRMGVREGRGLLGKVFRCYCHQPQNRPRLQKQQRVPSLTLLRGFFVVALLLAQFPLLAATIPQFQFPRPDSACKRARAHRYRQHSHCHLHLHAVRRPVPATRAKQSPHGGERTRKQPAAAVVERHQNDLCGSNFDDFRRQCSQRESAPPGSGEGHPRPHPVLRPHSSHQRRSRLALPRRSNLATTRAAVAKDGRYQSLVYVQWNHFYVPLGQILCLVDIEVAYHSKAAFLLGNGLLAGALPPQPFLLPS